MLFYTLQKNQDGFYVVFRVLVGVLFFLHGAQKMGWTGGAGIPLAGLMGAAAVIEVIGGAALVLGLFVRPVAVITAAEMLVAYFMVHVSGGWNPLANKGEAALLFFAAFLVLLTQGAKKWSLERKLWKKEHF